MHGPLSAETVAIVLAAGSGERLGKGIPKALVPLRGRPMLQYSLEAVAAAEAAAMIVVVPEPALGEFDAVIAELSPTIRVDAVVPGGPTRQDSVRLALEAVHRQTDVVLCHDAARPLATSDLFRRVLGGLKGFDGCVPVVPSPDTVKLVRDHRVTRTVPRAEVGLAQTPQAFAFSALRESHQRAFREGIQATDDAMLLEADGYTVAAVDGEVSNFKVTTREDLRRAEQVLAARSELVEGTPT